jgi:riboflavin synthase
MFTGIIEEIGAMRRIIKQGQAMVLEISGKRTLEDVQLGDSISVNGVCLTVIHFDESSFSVDVMPETFRKTSLKKLHVGDPVNLERAMAAGGRFGGHIVQGHVDSVGTITGRVPEDNAVVYHIEPQDRAILKYMIPHGSITIDGISLTLVEVSESRFSVSIIPHTLAQTILQHKQPGHEVNLEADVLGKYIERLLNFRSVNDPVRKQGTLTEAFLAENGFV